MSFFRLGCIAALVWLVASCATRGTPLQRFEYRQRHMGMEARLVLYAGEETLAAGAARAAFARIAVLDSLMSDYRADSELNRVSASAGGAPVRVSEELFHVLSRAQELARRSGGRFDVTLGPLVRLWREARRTGALPEAERIREAAARTGWRHVQLDSASRSVRLAVPGMRLDLGGIAKGYALDEALAVLRAHGASRALAEMGGDIVVGDPPPGQRGWQITVANAPPEESSVALVDAAISTSGDTEQFVEIGGERFSHVVDPETGLGLRSRVAATVIAPDGITADALSTLLGVLGPERGQAFLAAHFPRVRAYVRRVAPPPP